MKLKTTFEKNNFRFRKSIKTLVSDLVTLPLGIKVLMLILISLIILNNFFDLNYFTDRTNHPSIWVFRNNSSLQLWKKSLLILSGLAAIAHIVCNILVAYGKISNFFWGIIGVISYSLYTIAWDYLGDMQLNLFFFYPCNLLVIIYGKNI